MKRIYLIDYIGVHCGMHYYLEAFKEELASIPDIDVTVLSNYSDNGSNPFFKNHYNGNIIKKGLSLIANYISFVNFIKKHKKDIIIYLTYGNTIDLPFMARLSNVPNHIVDIHEAIAQNEDSNNFLKKTFGKLYHSKIFNVISHSKRTDDFLKEYKYNGFCFKVPHFKYKIDKNFTISNVNKCIKTAIDKEKINILFFGNLSENKGVDILIDAVNKLPDNIAEKINVTIAGKDFDGTVDKIKPQKNRNIHIIKKHISDDELRYLYHNVDYLSLPYRKTSQSGILEMAFYFKRPIIASDIPYFRKTLKEFPSFGVLSGNDSGSYAASLVKLVDYHSSSNFFSDSDYERYENRKEIESFKKSFHHWISQRVD